MFRRRIKIAPPAQENPANSQPRNSLERITFFDRYRISVGDDGKPRELSRFGAAVVYKAVDLQSGEPVSLKIIPAAAVDPAAREQFEERARASQHVEHINAARLLAFIIDKDDYVLVSEYPNCDTIASWVAAHGPLTADAALRVGLQVVSALQAAAFHGLTHAAIDPSNLVIVPGQTTDGGWPAIKITNLDSAGLKLLATDPGSAVSATNVSPQFASPEQLQDGTADFRSEIYSLGATMCFMLTGFAPLGSEAGSARLPSNRRRVPRSVRDLLLDMLRSNPQERPQDPVAFAERIREVLASVERRHTVARNVGLPAAGVITPPAGARSFSMRRFALLASIIGISLLAALLLAQPIRSAWRRHQSVSNIGVPVGIPDASQPAVAKNSSTPAATASQVVAAAPVLPPPSSVAPTAAPVLESVDGNAIATANPASEPAVTPIPAQTSVPNQIASNKQSTEPASPAEGPVNESEPRAVAPVDPHPAAQDSEGSERAAKTASSEQRAASQPVRTANKASTTTKRTSEKIATKSRASENEKRDFASAPPVPRGAQRARFVGTTPDGQWIFEAPSGTGTIDTSREDSRSGRRRRLRNVGEEQIVPVEQAPMVLRALPPDDE